MLRDNKRKQFQGINWAKGTSRKEQHERLTVLVIG